MFEVFSDGVLVEGFHVIFSYQGLYGEQNTRVWLSDLALIEVESINWYISCLLY